MKRSVFILILVFPLLFLSAANNQTDPVVKKIIEIGTTDNRVMEHLDILSNRIGGRVIGSAAYEDAEKWTTSEFKKWGLEVEMDEAGSLPAVLIVV
jgi:carboxypeptidase Q